MIYFLNLFRDLFFLLFLPLFLFGYDLLFGCDFLFGYDISFVSLDDSLLKLKKFIL